MRGASKAILLVARGTRSARLVRGRTLLLLPQRVAVQLSVRIARVLFVEVAQHACVYAYVPMGAWIHVCMQCVHAWRCPILLALIDVLWRCCMGIRLCARTKQRPTQQTISREFSVAVNFHLSFWYKNVGTGVYFFKKNSVKWGLTFARNSGNAQVGMINNFPVVF